MGIFTDLMRSCGSPLGPGRYLVQILACSASPRDDLVRFSADFVVTSCPTWPRAVGRRRTFAANIRPTTRRPLDNVVSFVEEGVLSVAGLPLPPGDAAEFRRLLAKMRWFLLECSRRPQQVRERGHSELFDAVVGPDAILQGAQVGLVTEYVPIPGGRFLTHRWRQPGEIER